MTEFVQLLRSFGSGSLSKEQLLAEVDRQLVAGHTDAVSMLAQLDEEHVQLGLPKAVHSAVARTILDWLGVSKAGETRPGAAASSVPFKDPDSATIVFGTPGYSVDGESAPRTMAAVPHPAIGIGSVLQHRFKLIGHIGEGGMSCVYKAIELRKVEGRLHDPYVAVKLLTVPVNDYSHSLVVLQSEAQKLQSLAHPNIVRVIDCDRDGQTVFMTMEYLTGEPLKRKFLAPGFKGLLREEATRIVACIASALAFAHRLGIVHGDLKPGNVIVTDQGEVKVIDFGIARVMTRSNPGSAADVGHDWSKMTALTPAYASPEMLEKQEPDPRDDVYALACIAYEMLTGQHPFEHMAATAARDSRLKPVRHATIGHRQFKALAGGLEFDRGKRTATVERFIEEFAGTETASSWRLAAVAGAALIALRAPMLNNLRDLAEYDADRP